MGEEGVQPIKCLRPESCCTRAFDSVLELEFHFQDIHGINMEREPKPRKRPREECEGIQQGLTKKRRRTKKQDGIKEYCFVSVTIEATGACSPNKYASSSDCSTSVESVSNEGKDSGTNTPLSSVASEIPIDPAILPQAEIVTEFAPQ